MTRPRAADDFETIRARVEELRLERDRALTGQKRGSPGFGTTARDETRKDERSLLRTVLLRKLVR